MDRPTCATCMHFDPRKADLKPPIGDCRKFPQRDPASGRGVLMVVDGDFGCDGHPMAWAYLTDTRPASTQSHPIVIGCTAGVIQ